MSDYARAHIRIARPSRDLAAAERFWTRGLGMDVLFRTEPAPRDGAGGEYDLLMVGWPDAAWHLELAHEPGAEREFAPGPDDAGPGHGQGSGPAPAGGGPVRPAPTEEDLLVVYLDGLVPQELVARLEQHGGVRVAARNPYWDRWGVTVRDPDGYRLVLSTRGWPTSRTAQGS